MHLKMTHNSFKSIRQLVGSQWRCFRTMILFGWVRRPALQTSLAAAFWIAWSFFIWYPWMPAKRLLPLSSLEVTNAWTNFFVVLLSSKCRIFPNRQREYEADRQTLATWSDIMPVTWKIIPILRTDVELRIVTSPAFTVFHAADDLNLEVKLIISDFESFRERKFDVIQILISSMQGSSDEMEFPSSHVT